MAVDIDAAKPRRTKAREGFFGKPQDAVTCPKCKTILAAVIGDERDSKLKLTGTVIDPATLNAGGIAALKEGKTIAQAKAAKVPVA
jgi:hypothetical protein